jgi:ATP-dependent DNA helicase RecQ
VLLYRLEDKRLHSYFLAGKYPDRGESSQVMHCLTKLFADESREYVTASELATLAGVSPKRAKVIVAQLEGAELVERKRDRIKLVRGPRDQEELDQLLSEYEQRRGNDKERIEAVMHYAQSPSCRMKQLVVYFGEEEMAECGHCDNCLANAGSGQRAATSQSTPTMPLNVDRLIASACGNVAPEEVVG